MAATKISEARKYLMGALGTIEGAKGALRHGGEVDPEECLNTIKGDIKRALDEICSMSGPEERNK